VGCELLEKLGTKKLLRFLVNELADAFGKNVAYGWTDTIAALIRAWDHVTGLCLPHSYAQIDYFVQPDGHYTIGMSMKFGVVQFKYGEASCSPCEHCEDNERREQRP